MASSIFGKQPPAQNSVNAMQLLQLLRSQDPQMIAHILMDTNPQFAQFYEQNKNKSVDELSREYGVDLNGLLRMFK